MDSEAVCWGFIGAGGVARRQMLPAVAARAEVRVGAVMVRDRARAAALAAEFGAAAAYHRSDDLLSDPQVEAVYIATPLNTHAELVCAAAAAGKHVLLEKPMALNLAQCDQMIAAADAAGITLAVCFPMRHAPANVQLRELLAAGRLGELVHLRSQMVKWYPLTTDAWRADPAQSGGGVLMDLGSHLFDLATWLAGPPTAVCAALAQRAWPVPVEDSAVALTRHAGGATATLEMSFAVGCASHTVELHGTLGTARLTSGSRGTVVAVQTAEGQEELALPEANVYRLELLDFGRALRERRSPLTTAADGRVNTACLEAAYRADQHGWVSLCC